MSVLIKGMDMPENCFQCPCVDGEYGVCQAVDSYEIGSMNFRPPFCPLVKVPKHGRLVDADEVIERAVIEAEGLENITTETFPSLVEWLVGKSATVVEAEE